MEVHRFFSCASACSHQNMCQFQINVWDSLSLISSVVMVQKMTCMKILTNNRIVSNHFPYTDWLSPQIHWFFSCVSARSHQKTCQFQICMRQFIPNLQQHHGAKDDANENTDQQSTGFTEVSHMLWCYTAMCRWKYYGTLRYIISSKCHQTILSFRITQPHVQWCNIITAPGCLCGGKVVLELLILKEKQTYTQKRHFVPKRYNYVILL